MLRIRRFNIKNGKAQNFGSFDEQMDNTAKRRKQTNNDFHETIPSTHCCRCHMETVDRLVSSIHSEYKKMITTLQETIQELNALLKLAEEKVNTLNQDILTISTNLSRDIEASQNKIQTLQQIVKKFAVMFRDENQESERQLKQRSHWDS